MIKFILKSKKKMAEPFTETVKVGKYTLTSHAQNRIADPARNLKKFYILDNLFREPLGYRDFKINKLGQPSYIQVGRYASTVINPLNNNVVTARRPNGKDAKVLDLERKGDRYVKIK